MWVLVKEKIGRFLRRPTVAQVAVMIAWALVEALADSLASKYRPPRVPSGERELPYRE